MATISRAGKLYADLLAYQHMSGKSAPDVLIISTEMWDEVWEEERRRGKDGEITKDNLDIAIMDTRIVSPSRREIPSGEWPRVVLSYDQLMQAESS